VYESGEKGEHWHSYLHHNFTKMHEERGEGREGERADLVARKKEEKIKALLNIPSLRQKKIEDGATPRRNARMQEKRNPC